MSVTTTRSTAWSVTINNPTAQDEECIALARQKGWIVEGQLEVGAEGTPHYQLFVKTPQTRFSQVKKAFPRAHIEIARDPVALKKYVHKEETREGELAVSSEMYPSMSKVWEMFYRFTQRHYDAEEYDDHHTQHEELVRQPLVVWDRFIRSKIEEGYYVESIGINPQSRSSVTHYWEAILAREARKVTLQTEDRQTDTESSSVATEYNINE